MQTQLESAHLHRWGDIWFKILKIGKSINDNKNMTEKKKIGKSAKFDIFPCRAYLLPKGKDFTFFLQKNLNCMGSNTSFSQVCFCYTIFARIQVMSVFKKQNKKHRDFMHGDVVVQSSMKRFVCRYSVWKTKVGTFL